MEPSGVLPGEPLDESVPISQAAEAAESGAMNVGAAGPDPAQDDDAPSRAGEADTDRA